MNEITVTATLEQVEVVTRIVKEQLEVLDCITRIKIQLLVAIDELFSNIAKYAYKTKTGPVTIRVWTEEAPLSFNIAFIDYGVPYDPLADRRPDTTCLPASQRPIGGLGLFMVKKTMDDICYAHQDGRNILTIRKRIISNATAA